MYMLKQKYYVTITKYEKLSNADFMTKIFDIVIYLYLVTWQ